MNNYLPHSFAVQCTMSEHKIIKSIIAFKHIAQSILILTMQKYLWKIVLDFFCQIVLMQLVLVHQMMTKQILIWFLHNKKWNMICMYKHQKKHFWKCAKLPNLISWLQIWYDKCKVSLRHHIFCYWSVNQKGAIMQVKALLTLNFHDPKHKKTW